MGTIVGVFVGYVLGSRTDRKGRSELRASWDTIRTSEEVRDLLAGGVTVATGLVDRFGSILVNRLQGTPHTPALRRAA